MASGDEIPSTKLRAGLRFAQDDKTHLTLPRYARAPPSPPTSAPRGAYAGGEGRCVQGKGSHQPHSTVSSFSMYSCGVGTKPFTFLLNTWMLLALQ